MNTRDPAAGIRGHHVGPEPTSERGYLEWCPVCGQEFDIREFEVLLYHAFQERHEPLPIDPTERAHQAAEFHRCLRTSFSN